MDKEVQIGYAVLRFYRWNGFALADVTGEEYPLTPPEDSNMIGFMPVYADEMKAHEENPGYAVKAIRILNYDKDKEEGDNDGA